MSTRPDGESAATVGDDRWRSAGDRIETLLDASSAGGAAARERAEALVGEVVDLYGAGLRRILAVLDDATVQRLLADDLVASLLLVHGLHPHDVRTRVAGALDSVRPYLGSHGGDVRLLEVTADAVVRLELTGSCRSCPSSSVTLELAVEDAVRAAAPEITAIEVVAAEAAADAAVIAPETLFAHVRSGGNWIGAPELADLAAGEVGGFALGGLTVLACRVGDEIYVYRDHCPNCDRTLAGAVLHRGVHGDPVLRCPGCRAHFDVVHGGARIDGSGHLEPLPVLVRDGELSVAIPVGVGG
ncbi:NifU family protein [Nocardia sp. BSTN01]|uniref:NifU family protein n=1 Tax=Nocardia sp. BSTN01 TaxID=2783665 RepID=UPI00188E7BB0|nr:NifU family protein [Nocardia sp. BSTN01]MBF4998349.1 NifU family protein [Nocardia sp. BSTN01]